MTGNQRKFADEYLIDYNGTRAYKVAYSSVTKDETAAAGASRLLRNVKVKAYIEKRIEEMSEKKVAKAEEVMTYLTSLMRGEEKEQTLIGLGQGEQKITEIEVSSRERLRAAELLGKRYALFTDKLEATVEKSEKLSDIISQLGGEGLEE